MFLKSFSIKSLNVPVVALGLLVGFSACDKKKDNTSVISAEATGYAEEQLMLEQIYDNADRVVERAFTLGPTSIGNCVNIQYDTTLNPEVEKMTVSFGNSNCLCYDGRYRMGKLIVEYSKNVKRGTKGYYSKINFEGYKLDGTLVGGHRQIWNRGANESGNMFFEIVSVDSITLEGGDPVTGASKRIREWVKGAGTVATNDDEFRITGNGQFIGADKNSYYVEIAKPLIDALDCNWINEGVINIFPSNATQRVLDFGDGQCESEATINVNGVVRAAKIP